jgi:murein DD-endopeptidase MepM/ murein hydrolase activator NlpD
MVLRKFWVFAFIAAGILLYLSVPYRKESSSTTSFGGLELAPAFRFGFNLDSFTIEEFTLEPGIVLGELLANTGVSYPVIDQLVHAAKDRYSFQKLRAGKKCALVRKAGHGAVECLVYEPDPYSYVRYHVGDSVGVEIIEREIETCTEISAGTISSSLWAAMDESGHAYELIDMMEDALAWSVDFHHVQKDDEFRLVYEHKYVRGEPAGIGKLLGAYYRSGDKEYYSIWYDSGNYSGFYDLQARPMKRAFLKAPVKYSRISSRFSNSRFHPVLKRFKGHFGTDYAAPYGTPIVAVADGIVSKAGYTGGNGNYVKIRHDGVIETQYLHMQKFASGIRQGTHVKQNQVIGYVGSTGLATGPHVCFRFWKNGKQVDHLRENLPPPEPMRAEDIPAFERVKEQILPQLHKAAASSLPKP